MLLLTWNALLCSQRTKGLKVLQLSIDKFDNEAKYKFFQWVPERSSIKMCTLLYRCPIPWTHCSLSCPVLPWQMYAEDQSPFRGRGVHHQEHQESHRPITEGEVCMRKVQETSLLDHNSTGSTLRTLPAVQYVALLKCSWIQAILPEEWVSYYGYCIQTKVVSWTRSETHDYTQV